MITLNVNSLVNAEIFWKTLGLEDEIALNEAPESVPQNLAVEVKHLKEIYDKVVDLGLALSPITATADHRQLFSFVGPEGNLFILIEQGQK